MGSTEQDPWLLLTTDIVAAYVGSNSLNPEELPALIGDVHAALTRLGAPAVAPEPAPAEPAVPVRKSVTEEYLVCLEDGRHFKSLKRHLRSDHNLSPAEYRTRWGLPSDYPMVAPAYAQARSNLARQIGLGQRGGRARSAGAESAAAPDEARERTPRRPRSKSADT